MTTVRIARVVKYRGVVYAANTDILVEDTDVVDLLSRGGWVINQDTRAAPAADENAKSSAAEKEEGADEDSEGSADNSDNGGSAPASDGADSEDGVGGTDEEKQVKLAQLRDEAEFLGIEVKANWGIPRLTKEIAAANAK